MEEILIEFINTLDASHKKIQMSLGENSGFSQLTISQLHYIEATHSLSYPTISEIADFMKISRASATVGINRLVSKGFIRKIRSTEDKRVFHVQLTATGLQLINAKKKALKEYETFITEVLSQQEANQFKHILEKLVTHFKQTI
ncbi:MAG: MarR family transcriptional regulator [Anaerolineaceae bacterium]|nr:MarR family transcriptional regulator [Anaerolineaceae bacterium]